MLVLYLIEDRKRAYILVIICPPVSLLRKHPHFLHIVSIPSRADALAAQMVYFSNFRKGIEYWF